MFERPVDCRDRRFGRETLAPRSAMQAPADLGAGPAFGPPRPDAAEPLAAGLLQHREHREAFHMPGPDHGHEAAPRGRTRLHTPDEARSLRIANHLHITVEI